MRLESGAEGEPKPEPPKPKGHYRVSTMVNVTLRNLDRASAVIDGAMAAGANRMHGIRFELEHPEALVAEARKLAVTEAKQNASQLAALMGVKLGRLVAVQDNGSGPNVSRPMDGAGRDGRLRREYARGARRGERPPQRPGRLRTPLAPPLAPLAYV